jgi:hypothetical protein
VDVRYRTTLRATMMATALLTLPGSACAAGSQAAPAGPQGTAACPETFTERPSPAPSRAGDFVPAGAKDALLCVYPFTIHDSPGGYRLHDTIPTAGNVDAVVLYLNGLAPVDTTTNLTCTLMGHDQYQVVLGYPADTHVLVRIDYNCGTASSTGAVRRLDDISTLLGFWPHRR